MLGDAELTDGLVAAAVADGSRADRERVAHALAPQVRMMVIARLAARPDRFDTVEDIAQQVMMALHGALPRLEQRTAVGLRSFVSRIVANKVADYLRKPAAARGQIQSLDSTVAGISTALPMWQLLSGSGTSPSSAAAHSDEVQRVLAALGRLKDEHREIITLAFFDQLPTVEIASSLGISRPAASMRLIRAIEALRREVTGSSRIG